jgi:hypothetical protein|uniref:HNH nuclease domain-containing protein n=1 Tax=viral metagenome TaxID=1070528 RepID=A0A6C0IA87_9ZZZZ
MNQLEPCINLNQRLRNKPSFCVNCDYCFLSYGKYEFILDSEDYIEIRDDLNKTFKLDVNHLYPYYKENNKEINILEHLYHFNYIDNIYSFKNNNKFDLRRENVVCYPKIYDEIVNKYNIIEYIQGHYSTLGQQAYKIKNCLWKIKENEREFLLMYCEQNTLCKLCPESYAKILDFENKNNCNKKMTWYKASNGYIQTHTAYTSEEQKCYYIHQIITGCYGNGKGIKNVSVDHIDRNPLNNTFDNLRIATQNEQQTNSKGILQGTLRERSSKKDLPLGISYEMFKKYVYYNREFYDKAKTKEREFFRVEHPKLDKPWATTKSEKVSILDKLAQANKIVDDLENGIYPEKSEPTLPKYVSLVVTREKPHLVFEKRIVDGTRLNIKMVLPEDYNLQDQIAILNEKIKAKYEGESIL